MPDFRHRLKTKKQQRQYDRSNEVSSIPLTVTPRMVRAVERLEEFLKEEDRPRTQKVSQILCDDLCRALRVPTVHVEVRGRRQDKGSYELHGLYESDGGATRDRIQVWMVTAKRGQVVAFKTFLRTLLHELCHHLDYQLLKLGESFHTDGFFKRESSLVHQLLQDASVMAAAVKTPRSPDRRRSS